MEGPVKRYNSCETTKLVRHLSWHPRIVRFGNTPSSSSTFTMTHSDPSCVKFALLSAQAPSSQFAMPRTRRT